MRFSRVNVEICDGDWLFGPEDYCVATIVLPLDADTSNSLQVYQKQPTEFVCVSELRAVADMQAAQLLFLCWGVLAIQLIMLSFTKHEEDP